MRPRIYLDHAATSPLLPTVQEAMLPWLSCGNPSSLYEEGRRAKAEIDRAREVVSEALGSLFAEVIFTASGTEAANLALVGTALANTDSRRNRILLGAAEHHCVLTVQSVLERLGYRVELIPVDSEAVLSLEALEAMIADDVLLVGAMHANNELGTYNDVATIASLAHGRGALLFVDAVQTFRVGDWRVDDLQADLLSISAHKIGGPKGAGALYIRAGTAIKPLVYGGGQERELRGGTENVAAIVGLASAVDSANEPTQDARDTFEKALVAAGAAPTVTLAKRLTGHCHVRFPDIDAGTLLIRLDREGISASSGAACSSGSVEPSHVLLACGFSAKEASEGLRFTFGRTAKVEEALEAAARITQVVDALRLAKR